MNLLKHMVRIITQFRRKYMTDSQQTTKISETRDMKGIAKALFHREIIPLIGLPSPSLT